MALLNLFTEKPYASALSDHFLRDHCSTCFSKDASFACDAGCETVVYCNEKCRDEDRQWHRIECMVLKDRQSKQITEQISEYDRTLARILTRKMVDGGVTVLSDENFPRHVKNRKLADLMSHEKDVFSDPSRRAGALESVSTFCTIFESTPLADDKKLVRTMYCILWTNCFSVSGTFDLENGRESSLGLGFYLNTSRFNHSCRPILIVDFVGNRIELKYFVDDASKGKTERDRLTSTEAVFNNLKISYGFSGLTDTDTYFPMRFQRRLSLKWGYFFKCKCELCGDENLAKMETDASAFECFECGTPYVWSENSFARRIARNCAREDAGKFACRKLCKCAASKTEIEAKREYVQNANADEHLGKLKKSFTSICSVPSSKKTAQEIVDEAAEIWTLAKTLWHRSENLRFIQLTERLYTSYNVLIDMLIKGRHVSLDIKGAADKAIETGEITVYHSLYSTNNKWYDATAAAYILDLARLYIFSVELGEAGEKSLDNLKRAVYWLFKCAEIWSVQGERASGFVSAMNECIEAVQKVLAAAE